MVAKLKHMITGGAVPATDVVLGDLAQSAYDTNKNLKAIGGWTLVYDTPTIKGFRSGDNLIVAVRGTVPTDTGDLAADAAIAVNRLNTTARYKRDVENVKRLRTLYPSLKFYAVGHSLGGAIVDNLIADGLVNEGVSFNPAVEQKFFKDTRNRRIAHKDDPLYALMSNRAQGTTVINTPLKQPKYTGISWLDTMVNKVADRINPFASANKYLKAHTIGSIFGRGSCGKSGADCKCSGAFKQQLEDIGYGCASYLSDARAVARKAGYDPARLEFSNDGKHKLMYMAPDGSLRHFGLATYGDFLIWSHLEREAAAPKGTARKKRTAFRRSHEAIKGDWRNDKYSPNRLALSINW
jgi:hypothetical protein